MSRKAAILKDASAFAAATFLSQLINIASAILMRHFLGPLQVGVWAFVQLILTYSEYAGLGTAGAITLEIPFYQGKGDLKKVERLKNNAFYFSIFTSLIVSFCVLVYALAMRGKISPELFWGLLITSGLVILQKLNGLLTSLLRAIKQFSLASRQMVYSSLVNAVLVIALSYQFRLYGFMAAMALSLLFNVVYIFYAAKLSFPYSFDSQEVKGLVKYGLPIMFLTFFGTLFETIDKIMISRFLGLEQLGLYSIALMTTTYLYSLPNAVGIVMIPNIHEKFGQSGNKQDLRDFLEKSDEIFSALMPFFIALAWFAVPLMVDTLLPKFRGGISSVRWLSLNVFFLAISQAYSQSIYVFRQHKFFFPIFIFSSSMAVLLISLFLWAGRGIEGVAIATTLTMIIHFHVVYFFAGRQVRLRADLLKSYLFIMAQFLYMFSVLMALVLFTPPIHPALMAAVRILIAFLAYLPILLRLNHRMGLFKTIFGKIKRVPA